MIKLILIKKPCSKLVTCFTIKSNVPPLLSSLWNELASAYSVNALSVGQRILIRPHWANHVSAFLSQ